MRRLLVALLLVMSGLVVAPSGVDAAISFKYRESKVQVVHPFGGVTSQKVKCPRRTKVVSGGVETSGGTQATAIVVSAPFDGRDRKKVPDDGWRSTVRNVTDVPHTVRTFAVCARRASPVYLSSPVQPVSNAGTASFDLACPSEAFQVTGGGVTGSAVDVLIGTTAPFDGGDGGSVPDDGWRGIVSNQSITAPRSFTVHAVCLVSAPLFYFETTGSFPTDAFITIGCTPRMVIGGGAQINASVATQVRTIRPIDSIADADATPDDGWKYVLTNNTGGPVLVRTVTICTP